MIIARRSLRAFHPRGKQNVLSLRPEIFCLERISPEGDETVLSLINVSGKQVSISLDHPGKRDILSGRVFSRDISLAPYEVLWLK